jgi:uncharacterized protein YbbC (DUF1343 family)
MKKFKLKIFLILTTSLILTNSFGQNNSVIVTGADQTNEYLSYLRGKNVAVTINQSSIIGDRVSLDSLISLGIKVVIGFNPEHGFRGGNNYSTTDEKTGIPIKSLYRRGTNKPTPEDLKGVDVMIFDMQDVGTRFYTYSSTLHYVMEACAENNIELIVLDRPNPNDSYVDGPVLEEKFKSFVGLDPVPIVHGMTFGEYAGMINGEGWLENNIKCKLKVIKMMNYIHGKQYYLPVPPSPNLNTQQSILLYPSLCLFEGTVISQGRGTYFPFQVLGNPELKDKYKFSFKPVSINGMSVSPPHLDKDCFGLDLRKYDTNVFSKTGRINLSWLIEFYNAYPNKDEFFKKDKFDSLAGTNKLREQIIAGKTEKEIRDSWEPGLSQYKAIREKYLIYK